MSYPQDLRLFAEQLRGLTADTERIRREYDQADVHGVSPDGSVRVTMRAGRMTSLVIDPGGLDHDNVYLAAQVMAAVRQAEEQSAEFLSSRTSSILAAIRDPRGQAG